MADFAQLHFTDRALLSTSAVLHVRTHGFLDAMTGLPTEYGRQYGRLRCCGQVDLLVLSSGVRHQGGAQPPHERPAPSLQPASAPARILRASRPVLGRRAPSRSGFRGFVGRQQCCRRRHWFRAADVAHAGQPSGSCWLRRGRARFCVASCSRWPGRRLCAGGRVHARDTAGAQAAHRVPNVYRRTHSSVLRGDARDEQEQAPCAAVCWGAPIPVQHAAPTPSPQVCTERRGGWAIGSRPALVRVGAVVGGAGGGGMPPAGRASRRWASAEALSGCSFGRQRATTVNKRWGQRRGLGGRGRRSL